MKHGYELGRAEERSMGSERRTLGPWSIFGGLGVGAALMYLLDPDRGRRRRALLRDQLVHAGRRLREARRVTAVDISNRTNGLWAEASRWLREDGDASDAELIERVRSKLGRVVSHPHAIEVAAQDGHVTLNGPILNEEVRPLLSCVQRVEGVRSVEDRLAAYPQAGRVSALQGGRPRSRRFELLQRNWSPTARVIAGGVGAGMLAASARGPSPAGLALGLLGAGMLLRAVTNREFATLLGMGDVNRGMTVHKTIKVNAPVERVFAFWRDYHNFPLFMSHVREVQPLDEYRSRWIVSGPAGVPIEWVSVVSDSVPNQRIEWRSEAGSPVRHAGSVRFNPNGRGGTRLDIQLCYVPLAGALGHVVARIFGADPKSEMDADLMRMKTMIETGNRPHDAARPAGGSSEPQHIAVG